MELLPMLLLFGLLGVMMYFMTRRQRKAQEQQQLLQNSLGVGDRVMTTSGLYGTVADTSNDTTIDIEIAPGLVTTWLRQAVREKVNPVDEDETTESEADSDDTVIESTATSTEDVKDEQPSGAQVAPPLEHGKK